MGCVERDGGKGGVTRNGRHERSSKKEGRKEGGMNEGRRAANRNEIMECLHWLDHSQI